MSWNSLLINGIDFQYRERKGQVEIRKRGSANTVVFDIPLQGNAESTVVSKIHVYAETLGVEPTPDLGYHPPW